MTWAFSHPITYILLLLSFIPAIFVNLTSKTKLSKSEKLFRLLGSVFFLLYFSYKIMFKLYQLDIGVQFDVLSWINWILVMITFVLLSASYLQRQEVKLKSNSFLEFVLPFFCALTPIFILESGRFSLSSKWFAVTNLNSNTLELTCFVLLILGHSITFLGLAKLRASFSITVQARNFVKTGIYHFIRHPMYLGESLAIIGLCLFRYSHFNLLLTGIWLIAQRMRASLEEQKLELAFPEYGEYKEITGGYFPWK